MGKIFAAEKSRLHVPGPVRIFRPAVPYVPGALTPNAPVVNHLAILSPREPEVREGWDTTSARSLPTKLPALSTPEVTESGKPDCQFQMPEVCQPPKTWRSAPEGEGSCHT